MTALHMLAASVADRTAPALSVEALAHARHALVDMIGVAIGGTAEPVSGIVRNYVRSIGSTGSALVIGSDFTCASPDAALANATTGHALDYDDSEFLLGGHPSVTLLPAILAVAQQTGSPGRAVLDAYVVGLDVITKIARAVNFTHYEKGWHPTATLGVFGAAAAAARLLGLSEQQAGMALGLAASMASGVKQNFGTMAKPFQVGQASQKGVMCALLAGDGLTASLDALDGRQGFFEVYNGKGQYKPAEEAFAPQDPESLLAGLKFKKYACCGSTHPVIDAAIALATEEDIAPDAIDSVTVAINRRRLPHVDRPVVRDGLTAKFSVQYTVAAALIDRNVGLRHFTDAEIARADIQNLVARVRTAVLDPGADPLSQACELTVALAGGGTKAIRVEEAQGRRAIEYPSYMRRKFLDCTWRSFDADAADAVLDRLLHVDDENDVNRIMGMLAQSGPGLGEGRAGDGRGATA